MAVTGVVWEYLRLEVRRTLRDVGFVVGGVVMPVAMYLLFTNLGDGNDSGWKTGSMVGMAAYGAMNSALNTGGGVAEDRSTGWLRQLRITPMTPRQVVIGRALTGAVTVLPALVAVLAAGGLVNGVRLDVWKWAALALLLWLGSVPFTLLGLGNGYRLTAQTTGVANMGCNLVLAVVGGLWFPLSLFPEWLRSLSAYTPTNRFAQLGRAVADGHAPTLAAVLVLTLWLLAFGSYAVTAYRRTARTV
ncbi:ABC transporter permease [Streptomyces scabichelini]|uniref:ABC transporter permease n=1 Tax=Streptomyces scabichelini TaxID=2711217 RepID=UPI0019CFD942|nr:ABC transporter permease [Streptomyces scabichelini]